MTYIKKFLDYPQNSGLMFFVLLTVFLFNMQALFIQEVKAEETPAYDKNWVSMSTKTWVFPDSAFDYYTNTTNPNDRVINRHFDFTSGQPCVVVAKYTEGNAYYGTPGSYSAWAICLVGENATVSPMQAGSAYWDDPATMSIAGANNYNMINMFSDWYTVFPEWQNSDYWVYPLYNTSGVDPSRWNNLQYDINANSASELRSYLEQHNYDPPDPNGTDDNTLPMLHYTFDRKITAGASLPITKTKDEVTWDYTEYDVYRENPNNFIIEMVASTNWTSSETGVGQDWPDKEDLTMNPSSKVTITDGGCNISQDYYSFFYEDVGQNLWATRNYTFDKIAHAKGYFLYIRTKEIDGGRVSNWKVFDLRNGAVGATRVMISDDGQVESLPEGDQDEDNYNAPSYTPDNTASTGSDPSSTNYNGESSAASASTLMATLRSVVQDLQDLPSLLSQTLAFLPPWLITLISLSIGILVIIGVVKFILRG